MATANTQMITLVKGVDYTVMGYHFKNGKAIAVEDKKVINHLKNSKVFKVQTADEYEKEQAEAAKKEKK